MGLFFSSHNESELEKLYIKLLSQNLGIPLAEANITVRKMLSEANEIVRRNGEDGWPKDVAERIISDPAFKEQLDKLREEGVGNEDIRWWYGQAPLERHMMLQMDELNRTVLFMAEIEDGKSFDEASLQVKKFHPIFGSPHDENIGVGDDRGLPEALKNRINKYIGTRISDPEQYKSDILASSSFNALIRSEIRAGKL